MTYSYKMSCSTVRMLSCLYFKQDMSEPLRTSILLHLCECKECEDRYVLAAKAFGVKFNLKKELKKYNIDFVDDPTEGVEHKAEEYPVEVKAEVVEIFRSEYGKYAKAKRLDKLLEVYAVKEYFKANQKDNGDRAVDDFNWYMVEQICRKIDLLENLYNLSDQTKETRKDA